MSRKNSGPIIRALDIHQAAGRIKDWQHASAGKFVITANGAASRVFTPREAELFCLGLASAAQTPQPWPPPTTSWPTEDDAYPNDPHGRQPRSICRDDDVETVLDYLTSYVDALVASLRGGSAPDSHLVDIYAGIRELRKRDLTDLQRSAFRLQAARLCAELDLNSGNGT